ncbi:hypothetical protein WA026_004782 [Henosepilachna vigintioctopunctata]|uniref:WIF domain-containing protein n=1 Tax=Henosepilachna vigintioctopunctata TaxID=420089 RepID=A0AAW1V2L0_9CUCU
MMFVLGIKAELYYVDKGVLNRYALNFIVMIPAHISDIQFSWQSLVNHSSNYPYKLYERQFLLEDHSFFCKLNNGQLGVGWETLPWRQEETLPRIHTMSFKYKKRESTRNRSNLDLSVIRTAVNDIDNGKSIRATALEYGIDRNTSRNYSRNRTKLPTKSEQSTPNIYNCDETGCTTIQECPKVSASKHVRQVGQVTSLERGSLVTGCCASKEKDSKKTSFTQSSDSETNPEDKPKYDDSSDSSWNEEPDVIDNW